jgi:hypothetical protein
MKKSDTQKKAMITALERSLGIITAACREVGISRETFYRWLREDTAFKEKVDDIEDITLDYVESQLYKQIRDGSERSILFYMKYKGRKRGYSDSLDITSGGDKITEIRLIKVDKNKDDEK